MIIEVLVFGGGAYAGGKAVDFWGKPGLLSRWRNFRHKRQITKTAVVVDKDAYPEPDMWQASRNVAVAMTSLKLATAGALLNLPIISLASVPFMLYVFVPAFSNARQKLLVEKLVNDQVLVASRVTVCVVMGYTFIASLDATLYTASQWVWVRNEKALRQNLRNILKEHPVLPMDKFPILVEQHIPDHFQHSGERTGERMAPLMLGAFVLTVPMMGVNRAAAFLTTTFGAHLRHLGPYANRQLIMQACQQGVLICKADALGRMTQVDTLLIDSALLEDETAKPQIEGLLPKLRQRYGQDAVRILTEHDAGLAEELNANGNKTCLISHSGSGAVACAGFLNIVWQLPDEENLLVADMVLFGDLEEQLGLVHVWADKLGERQRFNFRATTGSDIVDIGTTVLLDFGLLYSVLFTYSGLVLGVLNNHSLRSERGIASARTNSASKDSLTADGSKFSSVPPFSKCC